MKKVSVFIVTYNSSSLLSACLDSLLTQSYGNIDIIVVDNDSSDDTVDLLLKHYPQIQLIANTTNLGFGNANNLALKHAKGDYIALLNPDATLPTNCIELAVQHMESNPEVGMGGGLLQNQHLEWQPSARKFPSLLNEWLVLSGLANRFSKNRFFGRFDRSWADPHEPAIVDWVPGAFAILRRNLINQINLFDPRFFLYYEEVDLCRRIYKAGFCVKYWPDLMITHIGGASSETVGELAFSNLGKQLVLWRMRSQLLYYRKWHGLAYAWLVMISEQAWHCLRALRNKGKSQIKVDESHNIVKLWQQTWHETQGGQISPSQPW